MSNQYFKKEQPDKQNNHSFVFRNFSIENLSEYTITQNTSSEISFDNNATLDLIPTHIDVNQGTFNSPFGLPVSPTVTVIQDEHQVMLFCGCQAHEGKLCKYQAQALANILKREELYIFFHSKLRHEKLKEFAVDYGLENEPDLDKYFQLSYHRRKLVPIPRSSSLISVTKDSLTAMRNELAINYGDNILTPAKHNEDTSMSILLKSHKYDKHLIIQLYQSQTTKEGKIKNPLTLINPLKYIWEAVNPDELKFFAAVDKCQNRFNPKISESDITALRAIVKNPLGYDFYYHNNETSDNVNANTATLIKTAILPDTTVLTIKRNEQFYELSGSIAIYGETYQLKDLTLKFNCFLVVGSKWYLIDKLPVLSIINLLKSKRDNLLVHASRYKEFKSQFLNTIEDKINLQYHFVEEATPVQLEEKGFNKNTDRTIYLSDSGNHVTITPVMTYGEIEIPVRTKRQIYDADAKGKEFIVKRNDEAEIDFIALLIKQHPDFREQIENPLPYFYLHKKHFLNEEWFLTTFEEWRNHGITVLGFNEIEGNKLNPHKVKIDIKVVSGINWFNTIVNARFGNKRASLKQIQAAIRNKSKYVKLDDGTMGILPSDWIEKFANYFNAGEVVDEETLQMPKVNFSAIDQLFEDEVLEDEVKEEIKLYHNRLANFTSVKDLKVPHELHGILRTYQKEGLNWLNFLDDFNFGGCLADDMGLGKSIQIIAFILSQRTKVSHNTNIIVVPTTLIFNWQAEVHKFAPSIRILTLYGTDRLKSTKNFEQYEIILTSYTTLLSDINFLKDYVFNYIFLDESQNIKNPETQRYKAVRLLKSRNKIAITGTPIENNTFDLYSQLSFACPGLLGSKQYFRDIYSLPIDRFKESKRALALQNKVRPFVLRRTKQQVASELPDKTEMVFYCEMKEDQRKIYNAYEKEFREYISATTNEQLKKSPMNVLKGLTRLRQICDSPALLDSDKLAGNAGSAKIDTLIEQIEEKAPHHKILVFSQFVSMLDLIKKELIAKQIGFTYLTGSTTNRQVVVDKFQNDPDIRVFLISLKAGGTGLNLTQADCVYIVDPWWNPSVENQAIDRSHRIGQHKNVLAIRLICLGTVEEKMMIMQESKKQLANELIKADTSLIASLSKQDLLSLFQ